MKLISGIGARRTNRYFLIALACSLGLLGLSSAQVGKSGWPMFRRVVSMNTRGITSTFPRFASLLGLFYNPASLAGKRGREIALVSESGFAGDTLGGLLFGTPLKKGMFACGIFGYDAGLMELNWLDNGTLKSEEVSAQRDLLGVVSYGFRCSRRLYLGASLKAATSIVAERRSATAYAMDFGALYLPSNNLFFSAAVQNVGSSSRFIERESPLPLSGHVATGYLAKIKNYYVLSGAGATYNFVDEKVTPEAGIEFRNKFISMNCGYIFNTQEAMLRLGLGLTWDDVEFAYAYVPGVYFDTTHRMNISYRFDTLL